VKYKKSLTAQIKNLEDDLDELNISEGIRLDEFQNLFNVTTKYQIVNTAIIYAPIESMAKFNMGSGKNLSFPFDPLSGIVPEIKCQYCDKEFVSLYQKQLDYNLKAHELSCEKKQEKKE
jgi:hypothetical protein